MVRRMATRSSFDLVNRATGGHLKANLARWRKNGESYDAIAFRLRDDGIVISRSTVHRWCRQLGIESEAVAS
jgi:transposase-like protein